MQASEPGKLEARANGDATEIDVFGVIGDYGLRAEDFKRIIDSVNSPLINVNINSPGGDVFAGIAAYNLLVEHPSQVHVRVHGLAASAASVIALAGDSISMGDGAFLMIHNAWTVGIGDTREMAKMSRTLAKIDRELAGLYANKTGIDAGDIQTMMDEETWLAADDAIEQGFADSTFSDTKSAAKAAALYDMSAFKNVPKALIAKKRRGASAKETTDTGRPTPEPDNLQPYLAGLERLAKTLSN